MPRFVVPGKARTQGSYQPFIYKVDKADPDTWVARVRAVRTHERGERRDIQEEAGELI